ncbi:MAG TPA: hypothetical protein VK607_03910 [Kofleriaceae bacterium]|nr:hypothetical protein [Kofleriaceae bacterium]
MRGKLSAAPDRRTVEIMRAVCVVLLIGCGFHSRTGGSADPVDAATPAIDSVIETGPLCASIASVAPTFAASACADLAPAPLTISSTTSIDTDHGTSTPAGLTCTPVANGLAQLCVIAAPSITIAPGVVLSAHGSLPLALFARAITIRGTVDVASHVAQSTPGAGSYSYRGGCSAGTLPKSAGGGRGGSASGPGGNGGDEGGNPASGGITGASFVNTSLIGGCGGTRGGDGSSGGGPDGGTTTGGPGGGAVWIVSASDQLVIEAGARINASGAGGPGNATEDHGGAGGGAGGLIVLQAPSISLAPTAAIFANGGGGAGGGALNPGNPDFKLADPGSDPTAPAQGGTGGTGGIDGSEGLADATPSGTGGTGAPSSALAGQPGATEGHGGGGGGGGAGAIRVAAPTDITGPNVSPDPVKLH